MALHPRGFNTVWRARVPRPPSSRRCARSSSRVRLEVLDVSGRIAATLSDRVQTPGHYVAIWDGAGRGGRSSPGLYFVRLSAADGVTTRKLALI